jgi:predicted acylesterase/phospholipase RssA
VVSCRRSDGSRRITPLHQARHPTDELYASAAIPGFARPVRLDDAEHVDGAIWSTTNADLVGCKDHDVLIVIAPMVPTEGGSVFERTNRALLMDELGPWRRAQKPVVFLGPSPTAMAAPHDIEGFAADARAQVLG